MASSKQSLSANSSEARALLSHVLPLRDLTRGANETGQLNDLARQLGARDIVSRPLHVSGMLISTDEGYVIAIKRDDPPSKQDYSLAHEIGHLVVAANSTHDDSPQAKHRDLTVVHSHNNQHEERLCEAIAAELLMPMDAFRSRLTEFGSSLNSVTRLAKVFGTSITATAIRYCEFLPEPCLLVRCRPDRTRPGTVRPDWQIRNDVKGPFVQVLPKKRGKLGSGLTGADAAYSGSSLKTTYEQVLTKIKSGSRWYSSFPRYKTESMGFGLNQNRFVISAVYPDQYLPD